MNASRISLGGLAVVLLFVALLLLAFKGASGALVPPSVMTFVPPTFPPLPTYSPVQSTPVTRAYAPLVIDTFSAPTLTPVPTDILPFTPPPLATETVPAP